MEVSVNGRVNVTIDLTDRLYSLLSNAAMPIKTVSANAEEAQAIKEAIQTEQLKVIPQEVPAEKPKAKPAAKKPAAKKEEPKQEEPVKEEPVEKPKEEPKKEEPKPVLSLEEGKDEMVKIRAAYGEKPADLVHEYLNDPAAKFSEIPAEKRAEFIEWARETAKARFEAKQGAAAK